MTPRTGGSGNGEPSSSPVLSIVAASDTAVLLRTPSTLAADFVRVLRGDESRGRVECDHCRAPSRVGSNAGAAARLLRASSAGVPPLLDPSHRAARPTARTVLKGLAAPSVIVVVDAQGRASARALVARCPELRLRSLVSVFVADGIIDLAPSEDVAQPHHLVVTADDRDRLCLPVGILARLGVRHRAQLQLIARPSTGGVACINPALLVAALDAVADAAVLDADLLADPDAPSSAAPVADIDPGRPRGGRTRRVT